MSAVNRIDLISSHLLSNFSFTHDSSLDDYRARGKFTALDSLRSFFFEIDSGFYTEILDAHLKLKSLQNYPSARLSITAQRERLTKRLFDLKKTLSATREQQLTIPMRAFVISQVNLIYDMPLLIKAGIQFGLYADSLEYIGTAKHHAQLNKALAIEDCCCFALTELGHGSNVSKLETTATFLKETREFLINTPNSSAAKWWIGGAAQSTNRCVVFAQMYVDGVHQGLQAFVISLRDRETFQVAPGIIIGDCGYKNGNNAIDNGFIIFKNFKVQYDALLDRFCRIDESGKFHTTIKKKEKRLGIMMSTLMRGRASCISSSQANLHNALTIAIRYAAVRKQFSSGSGPEQPILNYTLTRTRIVPILSNLFGNLAANEFIFTGYKRVRERMLQDYEAVEVNEFHAALSVLKALSTDWAFAGVAECRRVCGGLGYSQFSSLGSILQDHDVNLTWEGDNNVLLQQTARFIIKESLKAMQGKKFEGESLKFLNLDVEALHKERPTVEFTSFGFILCMKHLLNLLLHKSLAELQSSSGKFKDYFDIWNYSQPVLQKLAKVYGYLQITQLWKGRIERTGCQETRELLDKLLRLFLADKLKGFFPDLLAEGFFVKVDCEKVEDLWVTLSVEIGEEAVKIVDAIGYPDEAHGSALGCKDGQVYARIIKAVEGQKDCYEQNEEVIRVTQTLLK